MQEQAVFTQKTEPVPPTGRFAPSPSGRLHLGNLACSLLAWLSAKSQGGRIVLRIEDLDAERCPRIYADLLEQDLDWLGLAWDEGGSTGGPNGPYYQSECVADFAQRLLCTYSDFDLILLFHSESHQLNGQILHRKVPLDSAWPEHNRQTFVH